MEKLAEFLHALLCVEKHNSDLVEFYNGQLTGCSYVAEHTIANRWDFAAHQLWLGVAARLARAAKSPEDLAGFVSGLSHVRQFATTLAIFPEMTEAITTELIVYLTRLIDKIDCDESEEMEDK